MMIGTYTLVQAGGDSIGEAFHAPLASQPGRTVPAYVVQGLAGGCASGGGMDSLALTTTTTLTLDSRQTFTLDYDALSVCWTSQGGTTSESNDRSSGTWTVDASGLHLNPNSAQPGSYLQVTADSTSHAKPQIRLLLDHVAVPVAYGAVFAQQ
jgi:hypothetical protein